MAQLLNLVWDVYTHPQFATLKNTHTLQELLSTCLSQRGGLDMATQRILECKTILTKYTEDGAAGVAVDEPSVTRLLHTLLFLIGKHSNPSTIEQLNEQGVPSCIIDEVSRFVTANREALAVGSLHSQTYSMQLADRLQVLRKFYSMHPKLTLPFASITLLSQMLSKNALERDEFFLLLKSSDDTPRDSIVATGDALQVFSTFVCNDDVDWAQCGDGAFECFAAYFGELEGAYEQFPPGTELPPKLGLATLWRIALNVRTPASTNNAINLLLQAYDTILFQDGNAYNDMLNIVFSHLQRVTVSAAATTGAGGALSDVDQALVSRCVLILSSALMKSKGTADPAHAVRGRMFRFNITVYYRRVTSFYNHTTHSEVIRNEKGSNGVVKLEVHPLHTIAQLKDRIIELAELGSVTIALENFSKHVTGDANRVGELSLVDGGELSVTYQVSYNHNKTYESDIYSDNTMNPTGVTHVGQILSSDYSMFDCLLSLCEACKEPSLTKSIWHLLMLIPTQVDLVQQSVEQICFPETASSDVPLTPGKSNSNWSQVLQNSSGTRVAYLMQIIDNLLQPALEISDLDVLQKSKIFQQSFVSTGGFAMVLRVLISTPSDDSIVNATALAVALHIVHFLLFGEDADQPQQLETITPRSQSLNNSIEVDGDTTTLVDAVNDDEYRVEKLGREETSAVLLEQLEDSSAEVIEKLLHVAGSAAAYQESRVVQNALMIITKLIKSPEAASQLTSNPQSQVLLSTVLRSDSMKVREMAANFAVKVGQTQTVVFSWILDEVKQCTSTDKNCEEMFQALQRILSNIHYDALVIGDAISRESADQLARVLSDKLLAYPRAKQMDEERSVLQGYLETLDLLISFDAAAVLRTTLGGDLVQCLLEEFLFPMPSKTQDDVSPVCDTPATRKAAFKVLSCFLSITADGFEYVLTELNTLSKLAARHMRSSWGLQVSHDVKKPDMTFTGLKNQGCTCYMNSLLQVLFMSTEFREGVLATPLLESHRTTLWHREDIDLVGGHFLFEYTNGSWRKGQIVGFDGVTARHRVLYIKQDGTMDELAIFNIHEGRYQRETGLVRVIPEEGEEPLSESEDAAYRVLEQLQRAFCFMKLSKRRFFDPLPFVDACKSLNLNFNVYHQNDAAEFYDQLLDRIETATKGKHTKANMWADIFLGKVFGGKWLYQKIPRECDVYSTDKEGCGHWQSTRQESFLKVELMIRGKERIEDSLAEAIEGELMDGDNKISCDVCTKKMATVRRTCFGDLPNTLMLHLKRFDLDFQTFETVKLNNRMAFPSRINMLKYTKEGIEAEEKERELEEARAAAAESGDGADSSTSSSSGGGGGGGGGALQYESDAAAAATAAPDPRDYEYELQGVLVHAGVAQGGHYYSYIRDDSTQDKWYKFDDDEVTPFDATQIPAECFGGPPSANNNNNQHHHHHHSSGGSSHSLLGEDRTANALMLVYNKVKNEAKNGVKADSPSGEEEAAEKNQSTAEASAADSAAGGVSENEVGAGAGGAKFVNGTAAYSREVRESNLQHILSCYLLDPDLHTFVRGLLASVNSGTTKEENANAIGASGRAVGPTPEEADDQRGAGSSNEHANPLQWSPADVQDDLPLRTVQFNVTFLLDVILHCRERAVMRAYVDTLRVAFMSYQHTAVWFVSLILDTTTCSWFGDYVLYCTDALARATFVQILVHAVTAMAPSDVNALGAFKAMKIVDLKTAAAASSSPQYPLALVALLLRLIVDHTFKAVNHARHADELFVLIRDLAAIPCVCRSFLDLGLVAFLSYYVMPDQVAQVVRNMFDKQMSQARQNQRMDYGNLLQSVFEALAALLGVPQIRKVNLLQERFYWESELVPDAREALTTIFRECAHNGGMDTHCITRYFDRVTAGNGPKVTPLQIRGILDRFVTTADGRLNLEGFLQYHADLASYNPKNVWRDLHAFGYRNDLSRSTTTTTTTGNSGIGGGTVAGASSATVINYSAGGGSTSVVGGEVANVQSTIPTSQSSATAPSTVTAASEPAIADGLAPFTSLNISENCRDCLSIITFYECGLNASDAATRAIAKRVCLGDIDMTRSLLHQALEKLYAVASENTWNHVPLAVINDFIKLLVGIDDGLQKERVFEVLMNARFGFASVAYQEKSNPSNCRANEFNKYFMLERYTNFAQELVVVPGVVDVLHTLAEQEPTISFLKGMLRLKPGSLLTENEDTAIRNTVVLVTHAGVPECNGEYTFHSVRYHAGFYARKGVYRGKEELFTLYKCSLNSGGYQWFLSITPEGMEPGTKHDIDFYYAHAKPQDRFPATIWFRMNPDPVKCSRDPPPTMQFIRTDLPPLPVTTTTTAAAGPGTGTGSSPSGGVGGVEAMHPPRAVGSANTNSSLPLAPPTGAAIGGARAAGASSQSSSATTLLPSAPGPGEEEEEEEEEEMVIHGPHHPAFDIDRLDSSDSDNNSFMMVGNADDDDDDDHDGGGGGGDVDQSFASNNTADTRDYYD